MSIIVALVAAIVTVVIAVTVVIISTSDITVIIVAHDSEKGEKDRLSLV